MPKITTTDEWVEASIAHLKKLKEPEDKYEFVHSMIFNLAVCGGYTDYEMIGILTVVQYDIMQTLQENSQKDEKDE
jgi:hypothetical protein